MTRQENTAPILFTYENEERDTVYGERRQDSKRNPYLADYARQYGQQGGGTEDAAYAGGQREQNQARRSRPVEPIDLTRSRSRMKTDAPVSSNRRQVEVADFSPAASRRTRTSSIRPTETQRRSVSDSDRPRETQRRSGTVSDRPRETQRRSGTVSDRPREMQCRSGSGSGRPREIQHRVGTGSGRPREMQRRSGTGLERPAAVQRRTASSGRSDAANNRLTKASQKKKALMQRLAVGLWALGIFALAITIMFKDSRVSAGQNGQEDTKPVANMEEDNQGTSGILVQGIPAEKFAAHPEWTENLLTPNEYSRPGDPLETVKNIFVHYTANPGTSAAQNRSYFEQQKDTHERSVSAHFIIGYEGEIIQCVPLDEIAYAVATRNSDSISIECCYLEADGSFTEETYDSLIGLLAWLTDVYDLDSNDILRHYDCGGKKCPLYYTNHPGEWEQLKKDVDKL